MADANHFYAAFPGFRPNQAAKAALGAALLALVSGCAVGPDLQTPKAPATDQFTAGALPAQTVSTAVPGGSEQRFEHGRDVQGDWWSLFHSPQINDLVTRALNSNPDITAAQASLRQAKENTRAEQGAFFPSISGSASQTRERTSFASFGLGQGSSIYSLSSAALNVSYNFDVFGGTRRQVEQLGAEADYQRFELEGTYLSLTANVINTALAEAALKSQIAATQDIIRIYGEGLDLTKKRFDLGGVSKVDVLQQQANLSAAQATLPPLQKQLEQKRNQLAVYLGGVPSQYTDPMLDLTALTLPSDLPVSLPSQLVEQRPDIKAGEALLRAANAEVGVATANMLPQITLTGSYGQDASKISDLFSPSGLVWSLVGGVTQPIFEGGTLLHKKRAAVAAFDVAAAQYSGTVNTAFQNVADALAAVKWDAEALRAAVEAADTASSSLTVTRARYTDGGATYLDVLTAEQSYQNARLSLISAQVARFTDTVALFQALGGGWWNRTDIAPQVASCCGVLP